MNEYHLTSDLPWWKSPLLSADLRLERTRYRCKRRGDDAHFDKQVAKRRAERKRHRAALKLHRS